MANRYWVGGTGTWTTTTTNWSATSGGTSGATAPTAADSVFFDQAGTYTVTMTGNLTCLDITVSAGTVTFADGTVPLLAVSGSMSLIAGTVWSMTGATTFNASTTGKTITTNGVVFPSQITFNNAAGGWSLGSNLTLGSVNTVLLQGGVLTLNGFTLTTGVFQTLGALSRSVAFGTNNIVLTVPAGNTALYMSVLGGFTYTGTGGFVADASVVRTYNVGDTSGATTTNAPNLTFTGSGTAIPVLTTASWFNKLDFGTTAFNLATTSLNLNSLTLSAGGTFTGLTPTMVGTGTITPNSKTIAALTVNSVGGTTTISGTALSLQTNATLLLTSGTLDLGGFDLTVGIFNSSNTNARSIAFGSNNIILSHTTAGITGLAMAAVTGFTYTGTGGFTAAADRTRTFTFGTTGGSTTNAPNLSFTGSGTAVMTITSSWFNKLNFGTTAFTLAATSLNLNALTLSTGGTFTNLTATMVGTGTITPNGKTIAAFTVNSAGTVTLAAALGCTTYTQTAGTINFATFNLTCSSQVTYTAGTLSNIGTITCTIWFIQTNTFTLTQGTITPSTNFTVSSGGFNYNGGTLSPVPTFTHTAGSVSFGKAYSLTATGTYTLNSGTLTLNGFDLTTGIFSSTGTPTRSIDFGTNNILLAHTTAATTVLSMSNALNFTTTGTGGFVTDASITRTFAFGTSNGSTTNAPNLAITSGAAIPTFADGSWFKTLNFTGTTCTPAIGIFTDGIYVDTLTLATGGTYTGFVPVFTRTQTWTSQFGKQLGGIGCNIPGGTLTLDNTQTYTATSTTVLTAGILDLGGFDLTTGIFFSSNGNTRSVSFGSNNIVLVHTTAFTTVLSMAQATGFTSTGSGGFTTNANITKTINLGATSGDITNAANFTCTGSGTAVVTITSTSFFNKFDFGTTAFNPGNTTLNCNSLILSPSGTFTSLTASMRGTGTITPNGNTTLDGLTISSISGTTTLAGTLTLTPTSLITLNTGTLALNGFNLTTGWINANGTGVRSIAFGSNNIVLAYPTAGQTVISAPDATNFTSTGTGGFSAAMSVTRTFTFGTTGGASVNAPNLFITSGAAIPTITSSSWFNILDFTGSTCAPAATTVNVSTLTLATGGTYISLIPALTRTQTWTSQFSKQLGGIGCNIPDGTLTLDNTQTYTATSTTILTAGTLDLGGFNLTTGIFSSNNANTRTVSFGNNNIVLAHTTAATVVLSAAIATGFSYTGTGGFTAAADITRTFTFGTTGGSATNAPNLTLTGSGTAVQTTTSGSWFNKLDFGTTAFTLASPTLNLNSLTLSSGGTFTGLTASMRGTGTIRSNSKTIAALTVNSVDGTTTISGSALSLVTNSITTLTSGTLDLGGFDLTTGSFSSVNTNTRSVIFGSKNIIMANTGVGSAALIMSTATGFTWTGTGGFVTDASIDRVNTFGTTAGGTSTTAPNLTLTGSGTAIITVAGWFNKLDFGTTAFAPISTGLKVNSLTLSSGGTFTGIPFTMVGTGSINGNNKSISNLTIDHTGTTTLISALTVANSTILTSGTLALNGFNLTTGIFSSSNTTTRSVIFGSNYIYLNGTGAVLSMSTATNFTWSGTGGFNALNAAAQTYQFGNTAGADATNAINLFVSSGASGFALISNSWFNKLDFTGSTGAISGPYSIYVNNLILASGGTYTTLTANMYGLTSTIGGNGKGLSTFTIPTNSTTTLTSALGVASYTQLQSTTLDLANFALTSTGVINYNDGSIINFGNVSCTTFTLAGPTLLLNSGSINCSTSFVITSGSFTLGVNGSLGATPLFTHTSGDVTFSKNYSQAATGTYTLTSGTLNLNDSTLSTGIFSSSNTNTRSINFGSGNIILTHTTSATTVLSMPTATGFSYTGIGGFVTDASTTRTITFGNTAGGSTSTAPNVTLTGSGTSVITFTTNSWFNKLDFGSTVFNPGSSTLNLKSFTLGGGVYTTLNLNLVDTGIINGNNKSIAALTINHIGTTTFTGSLGVTTYTQTSGDVDFGFGIGYNLTCSGVVAYTSGTLFNIGTISCTTWTVTGNFTLTDGTITPSVSFVLASGAFTYNGGTLNAPTFTHTAGVATFTRPLVVTGTYTLTAGDIILNGYNITVGVLSSSNSNIRSISFGINDIILTTTTAATVNLAMSTATNFSSSGIGGFRAAADITRTFQFGNTAGGTYANSPNLKFTTGSAVQTLTTGSWFNVLNFGTTAFTIATTTLNVNGVTLSSTGTFTTLSLNMVGTGTINTAGKTFAIFTVNSPDSGVLDNQAVPIPGTITLGSNITCTDYFQTAGFVDYGIYNVVSSGALVYTSGTLTDAAVTATSVTVASGTFTLVSGYINTPIFKVTSGTFNYVGGDLSSVTTFTHTAGIVNLTANLTLAATSTYTLTAGTLALNDFTLSTGIFSSSGTGVRAVLFGVGDIQLVHTTVAQTVLAMVDATNFNYSGTGGFVSNASITRTYTFGTTGGSYFNAPNLSITSGAAVPTITTNSWFKTLDFTGTTSTPTATTVNVDTLTLATGGTYTGLIPQFTRTQTWTSQYSKVLGGIGVNRIFTILTLDGTQTYSATSVCSVVAGTLNLGGYDLTIGSFSTSGQAIRLVIFGNNNIILNTTTAGAVLAVADATNFSYTSISGGFISDASIARTYNFGGTAGGTSLNAPNLSITSGAAIPSFTNNSWFNKLDFTGSSCIPATTTVNVNSLTLSSGGSFTNISATMRSNGTIAPNGKAIAALVIDHAILGTTTLAGALTCTTHAYTTGNVDFANFNLTGSGVASYTSGRFFNLNILSCTTFSIGGDFVLDAGTITPSSSVTINSGSFTYNSGTLSPVGTFNHNDGVVAFNKNYALTATGTYTLTAGSLNLNNNLSTGIFSSTGTGVRSINFTTGNIALTHTTAATIVLDVLDATNFTSSGTGGFNSDASVTRTFTFGSTAGGSTGSTRSAPNLSITSGAAIPTLTTNSWFKVLNFTGSTCAPIASTVYLDTLILATGGTYTSVVPKFTRTQTWTSQFGKQLDGIGFNLVGGTLTLDNTQTYSATGSFDLIAGTLNLGGFDLTIGRFFSSYSNARSIAFGSNNIILSTPTALQTVVTMPTATNFTYTGTGGFVSDASITRTYDFGSTAGGTVANSPNVRLTGSGTAIQTFTTGSYFNKLDFGTTVFNPGTTTLNLNSLTLSPSGGFNGLAVVMVGTGIVIGNGNTTLSLLTIDSTLGTTTLGSALILGTQSQTILTTGTLNLGGFTLTTGLFSSTGTGVRSVAFGSSNIVLVYANNGFGVLAMPDATNFTYTGAGGFSATMSVARTFTFGSTAGGSTSNAPNLFIISGASIPSITFGSWFNILDFTGSTSTPAATTVNVSTLTLATGGTYDSLIPVFTRTQTWTSQYGKVLGGIGFNSVGGTLTLDNTQTYTVTSVGVLTQGTLNLGGSNLIIGTFSSSNTNPRGIAFGTNNIILATTIAATLNLNMAIATGFSYTGTGGFTAAADITRTFTFGTTGGTSANAPNLALTGLGTSVITVTNNSWFNKLDFGTTQFDPGATSLNLNNLTLSTGGTFTSLTATMRGTGTITSTSKTIAALTINHTGTTTLAGSLSTGVTLTTALTSGTLNLNNFTLTTGVFSSSNTNIRSIQFGTGNIVLVNSSPGLTNLSMAIATNFTLTGTGGFTAAADISRTFTFGSSATEKGSSANAPNLTLTGSGTAVQVTTSGSWFNKLDYGTTVFAGSTTTLNLNSLTLSTGGTFTGLTVNMVGNGSITSNGKTIAALTINSDNPSTVVPYKVYRFNNSGSITFPSSNAPPTVEYLTVAGGGSGGEGNTGADSTGAGGGAGGLLAGSISINPGAAYGITVGAGGAAALGIRLTGNTGNNSVISLSAAPIITAFGGGGGGSTSVKGLDGGSGGGAGSGTAASFSKGFGAGTPGQGFAGGSGGQPNNGSKAGAGGGGGAGAAGGDAPLPLYSGLGGTGGVGLISSITGTATAYAGGGGGGSVFVSQLAAGGVGGGGAGANPTSNAIAGTSNTGGGGGGAYEATTASGAGGSGIVVIRYLASYADPVSTTGSPVVTTIMDLPLVPATADIVTLSSALTVSGTTTLTLGKLNLNNFILTTDRFNSSSTNVRAIDFGTGSISLTTATTGITVLSMADATNFSYTGTGGFTSAMVVTRTFSFGTTGGSSTNAPNLSLTSGASVPTLTSGSWFKILDFAGTTSTPAVTTVYVDTLTLATGGTYTNLTPVFTRTQTWTSQFSKILGGIGVNKVGETLTLDGTQTYAATSQLLLIAGTLNLGGSNQTFGSIVSSNSNTRAIVFGSNNITLATTVANTEVLSIANATNFTYTGTGGFISPMSVARIFNFGSTTGGSVTNALNLSTPSGASIVTLTSGSWFKVLTFTGSTSSLTPSTVNIDTLTLATGGTYESLIPVFTRTQTWTSQFSKLLGGIGVNNAGSTLTLDNTQTYSTLSTVLVNAGTLNLAGYNLSCTDFVSTGAGSRTITGASEITVTNNWTVINGTGFNTTGCTINMTSQTSKTFAGAGGNYGTLVQKSKTPLLITGSNTFENLKVSSNMVDINVPYGDAVFTTPGTYTWTAPVGVTSVNVVAVGGGGQGGLNNGGGAHGGGGGGLGWKNNITVVPGQSYTVVVGVAGSGAQNTGATGGNSYFINLSTVAGLGGGGGATGAGAGGLGGTYVGDGGGAGGNSGGQGTVWGGAGGAGGYTGSGGAGSENISTTPTTGFSGSGGGGAGGGINNNGYGQAGGGVGLYGQGANGLSTNGGPGDGGSGGTGGSTGGITSGAGGTYGGGGGSLLFGSTGGNPGGSGAVRIAWGYARSFPTDSPATIDFMVIGGGGGTQLAAGDANSGIGGGGAGGVVVQNAYIVPSTSSSSKQTVVVTIGTGGYTGNGSDSLLTTTVGGMSITALGGGAGGRFDLDGQAGGSGGGGGGRDYPPGAGGAAQQPTSASGGYGNIGGRSRTGNEGGGTSAGGGGGGAGAIGENGVSQFGGNGGAGLVTNLISTNLATSLGIGEISGSSVYFAGGGGGMANGSGGSGGLGGGAPGASSTYQGTGGAGTTQSNANGIRNGKANTGSGAGGGSPDFTYGGTGGSGIVIIRLLQGPRPAITVTGGCTVSYDGLYVVYTFKSSGTITF